MDDSKEDLILAERLIRHCTQKHPIILLQSGEEAKAYLEQSCGRSEAGGNGPGVLLLVDLNMAPVHGLEVLRYIEKRGWGKQVLSVMISGMRDMKDVRAGYQLGAKTFLLKPLKEADMLQMFNAVQERLNIEVTADGCAMAMRTGEDERARARLD